MIGTDGCGLLNHVQIYIDEGKESSWPSARLKLCQCSFMTRLKLTKIFPSKLLNSLNPQSFSLLSFYVVKLRLSREEEDMAKAGETETVMTMKTALERKREGGDKG